MTGTVAHSRRRREWCCVTPLLVVILLVSCASAAPQSDLNAVVVMVIDGDTIAVEIGDREARVRLVGIDTPEIAHPARGDSPATGAECFADEAHQFLREMLPIGSEVRIERDVVGRDHYDRVLGYVHRGDGVFVNYESVRQGYARPLSIAPNLAHADLMVRAAELAEQSDVGLWSTC